ncbi:MAG TPA: TrkH family potassium uptake protein [Candidatus Tidjanibacter faecipullorum]|uniref:TrkH family potassium uptake protein n=1 Tax=Candidatus Tidjanibacter faecipullorum TaxID=2838766 RepID=A0A9D2DDG9_9BACT|nr:TrkH family potassium uptake protein [Candidatus Tidjanibacter faecipullorum]
MRLGLIFKYIGGVLLLNAAFMLVSAAISWANGMDSGFTPLILSCVLTSILGFFPSIFVRKKAQINAKEGYCIVTGAWLLCCLVGTFPYLMYGGEFTVINAWFESVSGFTTTGSTILADVEALPRSLLFWRATTHWIGGVGVVMFALAVLPALGNTRKMLYNVELSPMAKDNFRYKTPKIIRILLMVYIGITVSETVLLRTAGMDWFDAVTHSFSTVATGGFSTRNASIAAFDSFWIEQIITFFTLVSGLHFGLIYATLLGSRNNIFRSEITRFYFLTVAAATLLITFSLWHDRIYPTFWESLRQSLFQSVTMISTTGFATADTNLWTPLAMLILIWLSIQCACAGSTCGGIKSDRILLALKVIKTRIRQQQHPNAVLRIKLDGITQESSTINFAILYIAIYFFFLILGTLINTACGTDFVTGFSATVACLGNVGPGFGEVGSMDNFGALPELAKINLSALMLFGRLEIFGLIQLFTIKWWI